MNFIDLKRQYILNQRAINDAIQSVLDSGQYIMGTQVAEIEETLAEYVGVKKAVSVGSGTDGLLIPLMAWGIGPGDAVITTPFTFIATAEVIALLGATPVFVDIEEETYNMDVKALEECLQNWEMRYPQLNPKVVIPVSLYGQPCDMDDINELAAKHGLKVIEDACQSFGSTYKGKRSCGLSDVGVTSFFPSKPLGCYGDGGMIFTDNEELAYIMASIRSHGQEKRYVHKRLGINARFDTMQAAILLAKWPHFEKEVKDRQRIGLQYTNRLKDYVITPVSRDDRTTVYAQYTIRVKDRAKFIENLKSKGIPTAVHYPIPLHKQEVFAHIDDRNACLSISEKVSEQVVSLPMHPWITEEEQNRVVEAVVNAL